MPGNAFATSQYLTLELPTNSVDPGGGGDARSSASNAAMSFSNRAGSGFACAKTAAACRTSKPAAIRVFISSPATSLFATNQFHVETTSNAKRAKVAKKAG